jgi:transposase
VESGHATVAQLSRETGISENTLYTRVKRSRENREKPVVGSGRVLPENEEAVRLRRENKDLREENEILKRRQPTSRETGGRTLRVEQGCVIEGAENREAMRGAWCE